MNRDKKIETIFENLVGLGLKKEAEDTVKGILSKSSDTELVDIAKIISSHIVFRRENLNILKNKIHKLSVNYEEEVDSLVEQAGL